jgi:hypothetical protein
MFCDACYFCKGGVNTAQPTEGHIGTSGLISSPCPPGLYCPQGSVDTEPCPAGTYSATTKLASVDKCTRCDNRHYCPTRGATATGGQCDGGYYCKRGAVSATPSSDDSTGGRCTVGHYCPRGSDSPLACPSGTYMERRMATNCTACPPGFSCGEATIQFIATPCVAGHYCPTATKKGGDVPWPPGTFSHKSGRVSVDACLPCLPGHYCDGSTPTTVTGKCAAGYYCTGRSSQKRPSYIGETPFVQRNLTCTCPLDGGTTGGECPLGHYCPEGSALPTPCNGGSYCGKTGLASVQGNCTAASYCSLGAHSSTQHECALGYYCPAGSGPAPVPCPRGTYGDIKGLTASAKCTKCTAGSYCATMGLKQPTGLCLPGYYCPTGQSEPEPLSYPCTVGHRCGLGTAAPQACPAGTYQDATGKPSCMDCPPSHLCDVPGISSLGQAGVSVCRGHALHCRRVLPRQDIGVEQLPRRDVLRPPQPRVEHLLHTLQGRLVLWNTGADGANEEVLIWVLLHAWRRTPGSNGCHHG